MNEEWVEVRLGEVLALDNRKLGGHTAEPEVFSLSKYDGFVRAADYFDKRIASASLDGYKVVAPDGWAYSTIHIDEGSIARNTLGATGVISPMYTTLQWVSEEHDPAFFAYLLRSDALLNVYRAHAQGSINRRRSLSYRVFAAIQVSVPPLPVQRRIVDLTEHLDNQIFLLRQEEERVKTLTEVLRDAVPHSEYVTLGDALTGVDSGYSVKTPGSPPEEGQARVLKISAVHPGTFRASEAKGITAGVAMPESAKVRVGDILISRANTPERVAFCARVREVPPDTYFPDLLWRLVPDETILCADYLEQILASPSARARLAAMSGGSSTSMTKITKRSLRALTIPLPSMLEQQRFAQTCLAATGAHRGLLVEIARLSVARDHLLSALLAGQSVIPDSYDELLGVAS